MTLSRRRFIGMMPMSAGGVLLPSWSHGQNLQTLGTELKIPEVLTGVSKKGRRHFSLTAQHGNSKFLAGLTTPTMGINGAYLGPTIRFTKGDDVAMHVKNLLGEPTTLHWHGLHVPAKADGGPSQVIAAGDIWSPEFRIMQRGGTFWYHSHLLEKTGQQVYSGIAGMIIIDDEENQQSTLPSNYGVDDIPLIVQDRRFNQDGSFAYVTSRRDIMTGMFGDTILVNGTMLPRFSPSTSKVRFRLLNAANARTFNFAFDDGRQFQQVASDGGLLERPLELRVLELAPAERAEIVVDFNDGQPVNLISRPMAQDSPFSSQGMMGNMHPINTETFQILELRPQSKIEPSEAIKPVLSNIPRINESEAAIRRQLTLSMAMGMGRRGHGRNGNRHSMMRSGNFFINNQAMDMDTINYRVKTNDTEIWEVSNNSMMMHPFHIHHSQFQILDRNGRKPAPQEMGFKDSVKIGPGETVRFIMRFENFSDSETPYMYHCHILEHEDNGMMGQFVVE